MIWQRMPQPRRHPWKASMVTALLSRPRRCGRSRLSLQARQSSQLSLTSFHLRPSRQSRPRCAQSLSCILSRRLPVTKLCFSTLTPLREKQSRPPRDPKKPILNAIKQLTPHENIYTIPNILTLSRLITAPFVGYLVLHDHHAWALGLFTYAGITDLVDGWMARRWKMQTVVGTIIDPMADKTLMTILTVCLAVKGTLPVWLAFLILGRDVGLAISAIYYRYISLPPPKTFARFWDFSLPSAEVHPTTISKYNTALQLALIGATTGLPLVTADVSLFMTALQYTVATTTIWSGASYAFSRDAVKLLSQDDSPPHSTDSTLKKKP